METRHTEIEAHALHVAFAECLAQPGDRGAKESEARILDFLCCVLRFGISVERNQPPLRPQALEDRAAVPAPAERPIHVAAVGTDGQCFDRFGEEYWLVHARPSQRESLHAWRRGACSGECLLQLERPNAGSARLEIMTLTD